MKWCAQATRMSRAHQRRHAGADAERPRVRRRRHRPLPHRAHVLRGRPHRRDARDDPRRDARGPRRRRWPSCCRISATTSPASSGRSRATRRRSASSIRRCTSSCRTRRSSRRTWRRSSASRSRRSQRASTQLHEFNPMLGFRGCRLGIGYPEITEMQARAVFEAAATCRRRASRCSRRS